MRTPGNIVKAVTLACERDEAEAFAGALKQAGPSRRPSLRSLPHQVCRLPNPRLMADQNRLRLQSPLDENAGSDQSSGAIGADLACIYNPGKAGIALLMAEKTLTSRYGRPIRRLGTQARPVDHPTSYA